MRPNLRKLALALPCLSLALLVSVGAAPKLLAKKKVTAADPGMNEHKRAMQALNRLTFGPRPGDVQQVMAMGVDRWIDLQLHPEKIPDSAIESRLAAFRTLHMSSKEIAEEFPDNQMVKQVMDGKRSMPSDPAKRAIYQVQIARLQEKQEKKKEKNDLKAESAPVPATSIPATPIPDTQVPAAQVPAAPQASDSAKTAEELAAAASADAANSAPNNLADTNSNSMGANSMSENAMLASTGDATASAGVPHVSPPSRDMGTPTNEMATTLEMKPPSTADARRRENHERENHERENHEREQSRGRSPLRQFKNSGAHQSSSRSALQKSFSLVSRRASGICRFVARRQRQSANRRLPRRHGAEAKRNAAGHEQPARAGCGRAGSGQAPARNLQRSPA